MFDSFDLDQVVYVTGTREPTSKFKSYSSRVLARVKMKPILHIRKDLEPLQYRGTSLIRNTLLLNPLQ